MDFGRLYFRFCQMPNCLPHNGKHSPPSLAVAESHYYLAEAGWAWREGLAIIMRVCGQRSSNSTFIFKQRKRGRSDALFLSYKETKIFQKNEITLCIHSHFSSLKSFLFEIYADKPED